MKKYLKHYTMKRLLLSIFAVALAFGAAAQNDSLTFVNAKWNVKQIAKGISNLYAFFRNVTWTTVSYM